MAGTRSWTLHIPAPTALWSANDSHKQGPRASSANRAAWRQAAYNTCTLHRLPKNLARIRLDFLFHFTNRLHRDALNYADTAKPVIDGFGPPFVQAPTKKKPKGASAPGWTLIANDTPEFLESTSLAIGPLWPDVLAGMDDRQARRLASPFGGLTVTVTDLSPVAAPELTVDAILAARTVLPYVDDEGFTVTRVDGQLFVVARPISDRAAIDLSAVLVRAVNDFSNTSTREVPTHG